MQQKKLLAESDLAALAKSLRIKAGKNRSDVGRELDVSHVSIYRAEENPAESLNKLRIRMIERYSDFAVSGPFFRLMQK